MDTILITGMPGARKSDVANLLSSYGHKKLNMSSVIREIIDQKGLEPSPDNYYYVGQRLRQEFGKDIIARKTLDSLRMERSDETMVIIDGLRNRDEFEYFKSQCKRCWLVSVIASPNARYSRMRKRSGHELQSMNDLLRLDQQNIELGVPELMCMADYAIISEDYHGLSLNHMIDRIHKLIISGR